MRKYLLALVVFALAGAARAEAQPTVYVSNLTGHQVLAVDGTTGNTTIVLSGSDFNSATFTPEDMVIGPDGKLYICDVGVSPAIWRFDPTQPVGASNPLKVVDFTTVVPAGVVPAGPTFSGSDDLYVNSRGMGVWAVPGVAAAGSTPPCTAVQVFPSSLAGSGGAGTTVEAFGHLLIVDQPNNRVLSANAQPGAFPNFISQPTTLISQLPSPVGITTNTCGDVLVASGSAIQRFGVTKDLSTGNLSATAKGSYVDFGKSNLVQYFERDASNNLWVATNTSSGVGLVWKVAPGSGNPISSCSAGTAQQLVSFKKLSQGTNPLLTSSETQAIGVAIPATNYTASATFSPSNPSATFSFGHYTLTVTYTQVLTTFTQTFTALMSRPADVTFDTSVFPANTVGMRYPSLGGFVIQFLTPSQSPYCSAYGATPSAGAPSGTVCNAPVANVDYVSSPTVSTAFTLVLAFHDPIRGFRNPGVSHSSTDTMTGVFAENVTIDFWVLLDQASRGGGSIWGSKYVAFDEPFQLASTFVAPLHVQVNQPALSGNPLFNLGQNFTVSIVVTDSNGVPVPGLTLRISAARIDITPAALQTVQATNNSTEGNLLNDNGNGKYSIGIDTSLFTGGPGTYQFTIFGQGFPPVLNPPLTNLALPFNAVFSK